MENIVKEGVKNEPLHAIEHFIMEKKAEIFDSAKARWAYTKWNKQIVNLLILLTSNMKYGLKKLNSIQISVNHL